MKRYSVRFPRWHMKRLIWWAEGKGQTIAGLIQNTMQARIEANDEQIESMAQENAADQGLTVEEWKRTALEKYGYSPSDQEDDDDID